MVNMEIQGSIPGDIWPALFLPIPIIASFLIGMSRAPAWVVHIASLGLGLALGLASWHVFPREEALGSCFFWIVLLPLVCRAAAHGGHVLGPGLEKDNAASHGPGRR